MSSISCANTLSLDKPETAEATAVNQHSYGQILKSTALIGGSTVLTIAISIIRTKAMAVLLGPAGFGLMSLYGSIADLARSIAEMGINSSGVRQIAEAVGSRDTARIAQTVTVLRRISVLLGLLGAVLLVVFAMPVSNLTFGDDQHTTAIAMLSLAVFFRLVADGQGALIQGMRRIADLAKMGVVGTFLGAVISIVMVYFLREDGIVLSLVSIAAMSVIISWWYSRKVQIQPPVMTIFQVRQEATELLKLGFAFMASGFLIMGAAYAVRTMLLRMEGLEAAGFYQAAWTLGGLYVGIILQAMGADFYPRLTGVANDNTQCNRLVNEQAQISLLLAGPGVIATLTFAPFIITLFYTANFSEAVDVLRWICLGMALRVIIWPIGFIILAKGAWKFFFWTELAWAVVNLGLSWVCVSAFGTNGAGIAFFGSYVFHGFLIYPIIRQLSGFKWSSTNKKIGVLFIVLTTAEFCGFHTLPPYWATGLGVLVFVISGLYSIHILLDLIPLDQMLQPLQRLLVQFSFAHSKLSRKGSIS